jgi:hypothetical protein
MNPIDLEALKKIFEDRRSHIAVGKVVKLALSSDRSVLRAQCRVLTQDRDVIARVCWDAVGPNAGSFQFPVVDDLVLLEFAEGDDEQAYLTKRLTNKEDVIPAQAVDGHMVHRSLSGKKNYVCSDESILIGTGGESDPDEPLVLGNVMKEALTEIITRLDEFLEKIIAGPLVISNMPGSLAPTAPQLVTELTLIKEELAANLGTYVETLATNIVSQMAFTERGGP